MTATIDTSRYRFVPGESTIEDVDLDVTPIMVDGRLYTEADAERESDTASRQRGLVPGGKSLSGDGRHSPVLRMVVSEDTRAKVEAAARAARMSVSKWLRMTVEESLARQTA